MAALAGGGCRSLVAQHLNVLLLVSDDQGTVDLNCYGSQDLYTPNLDNLAACGTRFSQFYVAAPVCLASRASLLTGRYPQRAGIKSSIGGRALPNCQVTIARLLREAGYRTGIFGKWHLGTSPGQTPLDHGFDEFVGHLRGCIDNYSHFDYWGGEYIHDLWRNREEYYEPGAYFPDIVVREATRFLHENRRRPFFLYVPFNLPHYPLQPAERFRRLCERLATWRRDYAAVVSTLDDCVGRLLRTLDQLGLRRNTLIIFLSDNGHSVELRASGGGGSAGMYRGFKMTCWEGGIRVPCIASLPGLIPMNAVRHQFVAAIDWFPTIAELTGVPLPNRKIDGKSLVEVLKSPDAPPTHPVFHWQVGARNQWAAREGDWKLVASDIGTPSPTLFLSNLAQDPSESKNLASQYPDLVRRLQQLHREWIAEMEGPLPGRWARPRPPGLGAPPPEGLPAPLG
ncbi:MAG: sulfatase-like hydrolase/transferase [Candidatus Zipacnadales bacterium]